MSGYPNDTLNRHTGGEHTRFLQKPFAPVALARSVRELLDAKRIGGEFRATPEPEPPLVPDAVIFPPRAHPPSVSTRK
jgi:hypothetical protein